MSDPFLVFGSPLIGEAEIAEVVDSLRSGWGRVSGPKVNRFERMLEEYSGVENVRCLSSCTAALILGMKVSRRGGPGDEVHPAGPDVRGLRQRGRAHRRNARC